ncbi:MAG: hypothetical protein HY649_10465, partial [Acidobacteria bacterium]|nr:hypothetical protein [Acidobacteriota bacterium]
MSRCLLAVMLAALAGPALQAQTFTSGGTGALGSFTNPLSVTDTSVPPKTCTYNLMQIDMALGTVKVQPFIETNGASGCNQTLVPITSQFPNFPVSGGFPEGVFEFTDFTLQMSVAGTRTDAVTLQFLPNANNTPVWIRATGNVTINGSTTITLDGSAGTFKSGTGSMNPGKGGLGGPGGFRGGDGGNGGLVPTDGARGLGPGGGAGGVVSGTTAGVGATFLATNTTVAGTVIPAGNDLLLILRGGSAGGGGAGSSTGGAGNGGGGGGGATLIAASGIITVNGSINARGGGGACCSSTG